MRRLPGGGARPGRIAELRGDEVVECPDSRAVPRPGGGVLAGRGPAGVVQDPLRRPARPSWARALAWARLAGAGDVAREDAAEMGADEPRGARALALETPESLVWRLESGRQARQRPIAAVRSARAGWVSRSVGFT